MSSSLWVVVAVAVVFLAIVLFRQFRTWRRFRGEMVVTCPDNRKQVGVHVDARHAASTASLGHAELRLTDCTRWPEKSGCGQPCLGQLAEAPSDCMVKNILTSWYEGKFCASCGRPFGAVEWNIAKPALMGADGSLLDWEQVHAESLGQTLESAKPLCFGCLTAARMVRERPGLIADRSAH